MSITRIAQFALLMLIVSGCTSTKNAISIDQDVITASGEGYLLIGVNADFKFESIALATPTYARLELTKKDLNASGDYFLVKVPAGKYRIDKIWLRRGEYYRMNDSLWDISVDNSRVSYIGHITAKTKKISRGIASFSLVNNSSSALEYMKREFPNILEKRVMSYSGPGVDDFFDVVSAHSDATKP